MSWIVSEDKLGKDQNSILQNILNGIDDNSKNFLIKGFPGSGKSVLLAFVARKVHRLHPNSTLLLIAFTKSLVEMFREAFEEINEDSEVMTYYQFMKSKSHYDYILCDEVQDLPQRVLFEMRQRASHIIVAGDPNQSIFQTDPHWHELTVETEEIGKILSCQPYELNIIYRLSRSIISAVQRLLPSMNIFKAKIDMNHIDTEIRLCEAVSEREEINYVINTATEAINLGLSSAILLPTITKIVQFVDGYLDSLGIPRWCEKTNKWGKMDFGNMNMYLKKHGIKLQYVGNGYGTFSDSERKVNIMTFHSAKGLDFNKVFIPFANTSMYICPDENLAKTLFMVAMTRAKQDLYITYYGVPSDYLDDFAGNCTRIKISSSEINTASSSVSDNPWGF